MHRDEDLVRSYLGGEENALRLLIDRYLKSLYNFVYQYVGNADEAEDVVQEVFVKVWKNLKKFDRSRSFKTWIFTIAKNSALDVLKKKKTIPFAAFEDEQGHNALVANLTDESLLPNELLERADIAGVLQKTVEKLPSADRVILFLYYHDGFNFREIAEALEEPLDTIKSRHRRALLRLKKLLVQDDMHPNEASARMDK